MPTEQAMVKDLRKKVDAIMEEVKAAIERVPMGKAEMTLSWRKLQEGKMWLGKVLEEMGSPFPPELADKADKA